MISELSTAFQQALATEKFGLLVAAVFAAGLVRGFTGFGTAMVYMPFASTILSPVWALITIMVFDFFGPLPNVPRAWRDGAPKDVARLGLGAVFGLPLGLFLLYRIDPDIFRWLVSITALVLLVQLISGWRYSGELAKWMVTGTGALGGFLGGVSGLSGPPVIMLYMASNRTVQAIRANILLYLLLTDILVLVMMLASGHLALVPMMIGLLLVLPYTIANIIGGRLFHPKREKIYRLFAYVLIAAAAISNLPLWT